jgi:hypothetical protein
MKKMHGSIEAMVSEVHRAYDNILKVAAEIITERQRQIGAEGYTIDHDDDHTDGEIAAAAATYSFVASIPQAVRDDLIISDAKMRRQIGVKAVRILWPWHPGVFKPRSPREDLVRAGALIIAEIERLDRAAAKEKN